jgi:hypothetical protein
LAGDILPVQRAEFYHFALRNDILRGTALVISMVPSKRAFLFGTAMCEGDVKAAVAAPKLPCHRTR